jgi:hypothetical protein
MQRHTRLEMNLQLYTKPDLAAVSAESQRDVEIVVESSEPASG